MAKPIFICAIPNLSAVATAEINYNLRNQLDDYHVIVYNVRSKEVKEPEFNVLNADDMTPLQFEELQEQVKEIISSKQ